MPITLGTLAASRQIESDLFESYGVVGELSLVFIYAIAGIGLMLLVGYTGLVSLGHAAFLAIGAYTHGYLLNHGWPWPASVAVATAFTALVGGLVGIPAPDEAVLKSA